MKKAFLIQFTYEHYCQGYEWATVQRLVYARTYEGGIQAIIAAKDENGGKEYLHAKDFKNHTIE